MATFNFHPSVSNYVAHFDVANHTEEERLAALRSYEGGKLLMLDGCDLGIDFGLFEQIHVPRHPEGFINYLLSKLSMTDYLDVLWGDEPGFAGLERKPRKVHPDPKREAGFHAVKAYLREGAFSSPDLRLRLARQIVEFEQRVLAAYARLFPEYGFYNYSINWRLTESRSESLHVDAYETHKDFHQVKLFINLDVAPRIWNVGEQMQTLISRNFSQLDLGQHLGLEYHRFLEECDRVMFNREQGPAQCHQTHAIFFDRGDVWIAETRLIPHQVFFGRKMVSVQFYVKPGRRVAPELSMEHFVGQLGAGATPVAPAEPVAG